MDRFAVDSMELDATKVVTGVYAPVFDAGIAPTSTEEVIAETPVHPDVAVSEPIFSMPQIQSIDELGMSGWMPQVPESLIPLSVPFESHDPMLYPVLSQDPYLSPAMTSIAVDATVVTTSPVFVPESTRPYLPAVRDLPAFVTTPVPSRPIVFPTTDEAGPSRPPRGGSRAHHAARCGCEYEYYRVLDHVAETARFMADQQFQVWQRLSALGEHLQSFGDTIASMDSLLDMPRDEMDYHAAQITDRVAYVMEAIRGCAPIAFYTPPPPPRP